MTPETIEELKALSSKLKLDHYAPLTAEARWLSLAYDYRSWLVQYIPLPPLLHLNDEQLKWMENFLLSGGKRDELITTLLATWSRVGYQTDNYRAYLCLRHLGVSVGDADYARLHEGFDRWEDYINWRASLRAASFTYVNAPRGSALYRSTAAWARMVREFTLDHLARVIHSIYGFEVNVTEVLRALNLESIKDYTALMGIYSHTPTSEAKRIYRSHLKRWHPDHNKDQQATARTAALVQAWEQYQHDSKLSGA